MHQSVTTIYGEPATIKSSLTLTWPTPIAFYDLEHGGHRAWGWAGMVESGQVTVRTFDVPHKSMTQRYEKLSGYMKCWKDLTDSMESDLDKFATVVWDTGTVVWALDRDCMMEEIQQITPQRKQLQQIEYGEPNRRMTELLNLAKAFRTHLVITHHEADEYVQLLDPLGKAITDENNNPVSVTTGKKVPEGFKHTIGLSDWVLRTTMVSTGRGDTALTYPVATVEKSAYGLHMLGKTIEWPSYDKLDQLAAQPIPNATPVGASNG